MICPNCGEDNQSQFQVSVVVVANSSVPRHNRMGLHDVHAEFVLGCETCSETLFTLDADRLAPDDSVQMALRDWLRWEREVAMKKGPAVRG